MAGAPPQTRRYLSYRPGWPMNRTRLRIAKQIRGPYTIAEGLAAYERHLGLTGDCPGLVGSLGPTHGNKETAP